MKIDSALLYTLSAEACADCIYKIATDQTVRSQLIENGRIQLKKFDDYHQRAAKLIDVLEHIVESKFDINW